MPSTSLQVQISKKFDRICLGEKSIKNNLKYAQNYCFWGAITFEELQNGSNGMLMKLGRFMSFYNTFLLT